MKNNIVETTGTRLLDQRELARLLGCNPRTISNLLRRRRIPVIKVGSLNRFQLDRVVAALAEDTPKGGAK